MESVSNPNVAVIAYQPSQRRWLSRRVRRFIFGACLLLALAAAGYWRASIVSYLRERYWANQCTRYSPAPTTRPAIREAQTPALKANRDYVAPAGARPGVSGPEVCLVPYCWQMLAKSAALSPMGSEVVFLHELRTPSGKPRIVCVRPVSDNIAWLPGGMDDTVIEPPGVFTAMKVIAPKQPRFWAYSGPYFQGTIYYGASDPKNASHFSFEYQSVPMNYGGKNPVVIKGRVDGYLGDDDQVTYRKTEERVEQPE